MVVDDCTAARHEVQPPAATSRRRRGRLRTLTRRDKLTVAAMLGVPLLLDAAFIWFPALASVAAVVHQVDRRRRRAPASRAPRFPSVPGIPQPGCLYGVQNYHQAFTDLPGLLAGGRAQRHLAAASSSFIATPLGMLFAVIIDRGIRGSRIYQSILFLPVMLSLALIGIIWEFIYSPQLRPDQHGDRPQPATTT